MFLKLLILFEFFTQGRMPIESSRIGEQNSAILCQPCHTAQYEEWRSSRHSKAWSNDFFQFDYRRNKRQWCRNCHIPLVAQQGDDSVALALRDEGINCITCHVRGESFFAKFKRPKSPHNTTALPGFGSDTFCAGCHQFNFPRFGEHGEFKNYTEEPMQNTVEQFREGPFVRSHTCRDCHAKSPAGHAYPGGHDISMLREALAFRVCKRGSQVHTRLTNKGAGHNVPTGDVHRHIVVKAWRSNAPAKLIEAFYGRRFTPLLEGGKTTIWDSSLPPNTYRDWAFPNTKLGGRASEPINIEVRYLYGGRESYAAPFAEEPHSVVYRVRATFDALDDCPSVSD
tara:strand:- start:18147 stop:19166 length:1020 start_codon:yes stop_codon:yes gene_type:complete